MTQLFFASVTNYALWANDSSGRDLLQLIFYSVIEPYYN